MSECMERVIYKYRNRRDREGREREREVGMEGGSEQEGGRERE